LRAVTSIDSDHQADCETSTELAVQTCTHAAATKSRTGAPANGDGSWFDRRRNLSGGVPADAVSTAGLGNQDP
jgi:hypothetical protein